MLREQADLPIHAIGVGEKIDDLRPFDANEVAGACVSDIIKAGILPVAIEFMDRPCIRACEAFAHAGYPDCEALLIVEVEG